MNDEFNFVVELAPGMGPAEVSTGGLRNTGLPQAKCLLVRNPGTDPGGSISTRKYKHSQPMFWKKQL